MNQMVTWVGAVASTELAAGSLFATKACASALLAAIKMKTSIASSVETPIQPGWAMRRRLECEVAWLRAVPRKKQC